MDQQQYHVITEELRGLMAERLSIRARTFPKAVRKAGRLLPATARAAAHDLIAIEPRLAHPKLAARTDSAKITADAGVLRKSLMRHAPGARAVRARSMLAAEIGFRALVVLGAGLALIQWQSLV